MPRAYLVQEDGRTNEVIVPAERLSAIPETPTFAVGDVVTLATRSGAKATVEYGPFDNRDVYVVKLLDPPANPDDPQTFTAMAHAMTKVVEPVKVGDRVRVVKGDDTTKFVGQVGVLKQDDEGDRLRYLVEFGDGSGYHGDPNGQWWCQVVERVEDENTYTHDGVTYDLTATYNDRDNEPWTFKRFGDEVRGGCNGYQPSTVTEPLENVVALFGPLTRVDA
nr:phiSA1p31-related protein [Streptomyces antibioticus]